jgi:tRNA pseudouridine38-40 synthase
VRYFCRVEYRGTNYGGWQVQPDNNSIQAELEQAFSVVSRTACKVIGAGRTDAGVHARGQGMHIDLPETIDPVRCLRSVNALLPDDIAIYNLQMVDDSFHARFSAVERCYKYYLVERKMPLHQKRVSVVTYDIDWKCVAAAIPALIGAHDFSAFCASGCSAKSMLCTVTHASLKKENHMQVFTIKADRFIYKMVRSIVGTLLDIGRGRITTPLESIIASENRERVGDTASPDGLVLEQVTYKEVG